jgi:hypothetical protein
VLARDIALTCASGRAWQTWFLCPACWSDRHRYTSLGVTGVIAKPFDPLRFAERMSEILGWS